MNQDEYFVCVGALSTRVRATNTDDAVILAKARAIEKGYVSPKLVSVKFGDGKINYYCRVCGIELVPIEKGLCSYCPQELGFADGNEKHVKGNEPITPQNSHKNTTKPTTNATKTFEEFLKTEGGMWETMDSHFRFNSIESFKEAELKLVELKQEGDSHVMNVFFGYEFEDNHLNFQLQFGSPKGEIKIWKGKTWAEQNFHTMKEVFEFMKKVTHQHFKLVPPAT